MIMSRPILILLTMLLISLISSCVLSRLLTVKKQLGDFDKNFKLYNDNGLYLEFLEPVITKGDTLWFLEVEPYDISNNKGFDIWTYILKKGNKTTNPGKIKDNYDITLTLFFQKNKLVKVRLPEKVSKEIKDEFFKRLLISLAGADINKFKRELSAILKYSNDNYIPNKSNIESIIGNPGKKSKNGKDYFFNYPYLLICKDELGSDCDPTDISIDLAYSGNSHLLKIASLKLRSIKLEIDFNSTK